MEAVTQFIRSIQDWVWGPVAWGILLVGGLILTIRLKGYQVTKFFHYMDNTIIDMFRKPQNKKNPIVGKGDISAWQALMTSFSATMGVGTLAGTATAIAWGGPGAVFWMWVVGFFGIATKFNEVILACHFRGTNAKGEMLSGPFAYMEKGMKAKRLGKFLAIIFAFFGALGAFGIGNMVQANSAAGAIVHVFPDANRVVIGVIAAILIGLVIIGGIKWIAKVVDKVIPFLALTAIITSILIIFSSITDVPYAFGLIFRGAFSGSSLVGGVAGVAVMYAVRLGLQRGIFSNEAGLGSGAIAYSAAKSNNPVKTSMWGSFEVFLDTHVMCTLIALVILTQVDLSYITPGFNTANVTGAPLVIQSYQNSFFGAHFGGWLMAFLMATFGFTTVIGWAYVGEKCFEYLLGSKWGVKLRIIYRFLILPATVFGTMGGVALIWAIADIMNAFMALPNIIAVVILSGVSAKIANDYFKGKKYEPLPDSFNDGDAEESGNDA
jgi:AGCS family alanine or glycine:cation symporter